MGTLRHLVHLLRGQWFRRLFSVRATSQFSDGIFQAALASYVLFSPEKQPTPAAIAGTLTVMLLPFTVLGPFAGVFLEGVDPSGGEKGHRRVGYTNPTLSVSRAVRIRSTCCVVNMNIPASSV